MNTLLMTKPTRTGLLLAAGLLIGSTTFNVAAQDRAYARQNGESRIQSRSAPATVVDKRGDSRRGDERGNRYAAAPSQHRSNDDRRGGNDSRGNRSHDRRNDSGHSNRGRSDSNYRYGAQTYGARDYRSNNHRSHNYRSDSHQNRGYQPRNYQRQHYQHNQRNGWRAPNWRNHWRHGWSGNRYRASSRYYYPSGYSSFRWTVGYVLPRAFYRSNYYVNYDAYGLAPPPYGTRWLRVDSDLLLVDIDTYEIIEVLRGFYYY